MKWNFSRWNLNIFISFFIFISLMVRCLNHFPPCVSNFTQNFVWKLETFGSCCSLRFLSANFQFSWHTYKSLYFRQMWLLEICRLVCQHLIPSCFHSWLLVASQTRKGKRRWIQLTPNMFSETIYARALLMQLSKAISRKFRGFSKSWNDHMTSNLEWKNMHACPQPGHIDQVFVCFLVLRKFCRFLGHYVICIYQKED